MPQGNGGVVGPANDPTSSTASGVWGLKEHAEAVGSGTWPGPIFPFEISRSLRFNSADSTQLEKSYSSSGNRQRFTFSTWVKLSKLGTARCLFGASDNSTSSGVLMFAADDKFQVYSGNGSVDLKTAAVFRDLSAWYHFVVVIDTPNATQASRVQVFVNGVAQTMSGTSPSQNYNFEFGLTGSWQTSVGSHPQPTYLLDGYMTEVFYIDGQVLTASDFGQTSLTTGVWDPKEYTGTFLNNSFYLKLNDNSSTAALGTDSSGLSNTFTANNFSVTAGAGNDSLVDTPTQYGDDTGAGGEVRGNYATFNPLDRPTAGTLTITNGNLDALVQAGSGIYPSARLTITPAQISGKYQWEVAIGSKTAGFWQMGLNLSASAYSAADQHATFRSDGFYSSSLPGSWSGTPPSFTQGDVITVAYDADAGTCKFYKNGVLGPTFTLSSIPQNLNFGVWADSSGGNANYTLNAGQRPFAYPVSGFKALVTTNLPEPTVVQGDDYFNTVLYTGNGSTQSITGVGFQPDWVWIKQRNFGRNNYLFDAVRGASLPYLSLSSNLDQSEDGGGSDTLTAFNSDGFSLGSSVRVNASGGTYVGWNWKAGVSNVINEDGTITSTVRANPTAGFSIVSYTGTGASATVGHGLGAAPSMVITKGRNNTVAWVVYHIGLAVGNEIYLSATNAQASSANYPTAPTSTVVNLGNDTNANGSGVNYIAYVFAAIPGYSAFGSYTGNGSADGPFVFTGFRPAWVLYKRTNTTSSWVIFDAVRNTYNVVDKYLYADLTLTEQTASAMDFTSNGFKARTTNAELNASGSTYIYAAFAENPFKYSLAR